MLVVVQLVREVAAVAAAGVRLVVQPKVLAAQAAKPLH
jgi:hypothetical protein